MKVSNLIKKLEKYGEVEFDRANNVYIVIDGDKYGANLCDSEDGKKVYSYFIDCKNGGMSIFVRNSNHLEELIKNNLKRVA